MDQADMRPSDAQLFDEVVKKLMVGDWDYFTTVGGAKYYVFGMAEYCEDHGMPLSDDCREETAKKLRFPPRVQKYVRSLLALPQPDYLMSTAKRLVAVGIIKEISDDAITQLFQEFPISDDQLNSLSAEQRHAYIEFFDALQAYRTKPGELPQRTKWLSIMEERDKYFLREISEKYKKLLKRLSRLNSLEYANPQLQEATHCWLYGFFRATVVLSATALEESIKTALKIEHFKTYDELVACGIRSNCLEPKAAGLARDVFADRTRVVHHNWEPSSEDAENTLVKARGILGGALANIESTIKEPPND